MRAFVLSLLFGSLVYAQQKKSQADRDLQIEMLKDPELFPFPDVVNQRYAMAFDVQAIEHILTAEPFSEMVSQHKPSPNVADDEAYKKMVKEAVEHTFDRLLTQYTKFKLNTDAPQPPVRRKRAKDGPTPDEIAYFKSKAFEELFVKETSKYLEKELAALDTPENRVKRFLESYKPSHIRAKRLAAAQDEEDQRNPEEDRENILVRQLRNIIGDAFVDKMRTELGQAKEHYERDGLKGVLDFAVVRPLNREAKVVSTDLRKIRDAYSQHGIKAAVKMAGGADCGPGTDCGPVIEEAEAIVKE
ncbi:unnamed protein product, partial [Mesorhabditis spiculigera]